MLDGHRLLLSIVVLYELQYGVERSEKKQQNRERLQNFIHPGFHVLPLSIEDVNAAARIRATLQAPGSRLKSKPSAPTTPSLRMYNTFIPRGISSKPPNCSTWNNSNTIQL